MDFVQGDIVRYIGTNDDLHGIDYGKLLIVSDCIFKSQEMYISMLSTDVNDINVYEAAPQYLELVDKELHKRTSQVNTLVADLDSLLMTHDVVMSNITTTVGHDRVENVIDGKSKISLIPDGSISYDIKLTFVKRGD